MLLRMIREMKVINDWFGCVIDIYVINSVDGTILSWSMSYLYICLPVGQRDRHSCNVQSDLGTSHFRMGCLSIHPLYLN